MGGGACQPEGKKPPLSPPLWSDLTAFYSACHSASCDRCDQDEPEMPLFSDPAGAVDAAIVVAV